MFTRCPSCRAAFSITDQQLEIAAGMVRCGMCEHVFDARLYLFNDSEPDQEQHNVDVPLTQEESTNIDLEFLDKQLHGQEEPDLRPDQVLDEAPKQEALAPNEEAEKDTESVDLSEAIPPKIIADEVSKLENESISFNPLRWLSMLTIFVLLAAISLQLVTVTNINLVPPQYRVEICKWLTCVDPIPRALNKIDVLNRSIYTHQSEDKALMVTVTIINRADFAQSYPIIQLRFLNVSGEVIAARQFGPNHYLNTTWRPENLMEPKIPVSIKLEVEDVGEEVVSYDFDFL